MDTPKRIDSGTPKVETGEIPKKRVLVVDDKPALLRLTQRFLQTIPDLIVDTANNGHEALEKLEDGERIDVLVTDLNMPGISGEDVARAYQGKHPETIVILATAEYDRGGQVRNRALAEGRRIILLEKPYAPNELAAALSPYEQQGVKKDRTA